MLGETYILGIDLPCVPYCHFFHCRSNEVQSSMGVTRDCPGVSYWSRQLLDACHVSSPSTDGL